jgi:hypothetical protein
MEEGKKEANRFINKYIEHFNKKEVHPLDQRFLRS